MKDIARKIDELIGEAEDFRDTIDQAADRMKEALTGAEDAMHRDDPEDAAADARDIISNLQDARKDLADYENQMQYLLDHIDTILGLVEDYS